MIRFIVTVVMALLSFGFWGRKSEAAATLPKDPVMEQPISIII